MSELIHQIDAQLIIFDPYMNMHTADQQSSGNRLHIT